jgi:hypothetical protein
LKDRILSNLFDTQYCRDVLVVHMIDHECRIKLNMSICLLAEQHLYKLYAQALTDSELTHDWSSWVEMMSINCQKCCSEAEISHPMAFRTGHQL